MILERHSIGPMTPPKDASFSKNDAMTTKLEIDRPPPAYSDDFLNHGRDNGTSSRSQLQVPNVQSRYNQSSVSVNSQDPAPSADQVHIFERNHDIKGTFFIDPLVMAYQRRKGKKSKKELPHASFRSRKGSVELELATTGDIQKAPKANISVSSHSGSIQITLLPMPASRPRMGLDVNSTHGNVVLYIPEGYSGVLHLKTKKGGIELLPALATHIKTVKFTARETIFMIGTQNNLYELDNSREASFCQVESRTGHIVVGLSGRDRYQAPVGFWKRLGGYFGLGGESSNGSEKDISG
ncbi:hypothetical protein JR316_0008015 [Psilocybe cubensis]|uniref:DUF7330 domain-containing protein n=2 Tax=Psilocybe cubensis TaxID=181762 RepID=A0A8H7XRZ3_PSICU|nr:hypothetical protein JR316_0008015 [Psilocybe cubensis]KAH9479425.1 hypothetical protein JR316_0008015 [Psilocybe cubensis]